MALAIGGDETGALVADIGRAWTRIGFAGDDMPKCVMRSDVLYEGMEDNDAQMEQVSSNLLPSPSESAVQIAAVNSTNLMACNEEKSVWDDIRVKDARTARDAALRASRYWNFGEEAAGLGLRRILDDRTSTRQRALIRSPIDENGELTDWEAIEALWTEAQERIKTRCQDHPVLCGIPSWTTVKSQERYLEILFENLDAPAAYLARNAMLSALAAGRASALVLDLGAATTSAVPVIDGYVLLRAVRRSTASGLWLDDELSSILKNKKGINEVIPRWCLGKTNQSADHVLSHLRQNVPSLLSLAQRDIIMQCKHSHCYLPGGRIRPGGTFELPDGTAIDIDPSIALLPERLFLQESTNQITTTENTSMLENSPDELATKVVKQEKLDETSDEAASAKRRKVDSQTDNGTSPDAPSKSTAKPDLARSSYYASPALTTFRSFEPPSYQSIPSLVRSALERSDVDVRKDLLNNVVLAGGTSLFPGLPERIHRELADNLAPTRLKTKLIVASPIERQFSAWIGASILASLGSFQQLWLSKQEYHEDGALSNLERWT
uniref:Actin n=1 Tax=Aureoumbra lagunensis TaxID=44058 RepID=A0A7S3NPX9_9STRA|mmetsp:Transcript_17415/g.22664  ORF Transcript_17415/g.22664 Transcript_17415/m.22664 type:complete len:552 (-) Transcript_17415:52-1707(-)